MSWGRPISVGRFKYHAHTDMYDTQGQEKPTTPAPRLCPLAFLVIVPEVWTTPSSAEKDLCSDQFLWEGTVEGVAREGEFVDMEGVTAARRMISSNG